jgi:hypothetical protein
MASIRRQITAASATVFIVLIGLRVYADVWKLLLSYLPVKESTHELRREPVRSDTFYDNDEDDDDELLFDEKDDDYKREIDLRKESLAELTRLLDLSKQQSHNQTKSPACHPHFQYLSSNTSWTTSEKTKFKRLYFYHARKAGGTSLAMYFAKVATHHGLKFQHDEWVVAEEPGTNINDELPTFYVAHLREPVDRSISHFKYQGRWDCHDLLHMRLPDNKGKYFTPTEENSNKLETWNATGGHTPHKCKSSHHFKLGECAVNCYLQWFAGAASCQKYDIPTDDQYHLVLTKLLRYNFIIILEWLKDPEYVLAVENFFGVPGITEKRSAFCERSSHKANQLVPLTIDNNTVDKLTKLNDVDIKLYTELTNCSGGDDEQKYNFPLLDPNRFDNTSSIQVHYSNYHEWKKSGSSKRKRKRDKAKKLVDDHDDDNSYSDNPDE